jgi:hypothetical protein
MLAQDERAEFAVFLATLSPRQWQAPTLCAGWRVRDVVAHVISYDELDVRGLLAHVVRGRFRPARVNPVALAGYNTRSPEQLLALLTDHLQPRGLPAALGARVALLIGPDIGGFWRIRGVRLIATDLSLSAGSGPDVRGAAEALLMAMAGRRGVVGERSGPGQRKLAGRIDG